MDLATGAKKVIAVLNHCARDGTSKVAEHCPLPLPFTARRCVDLVITGLTLLSISRSSVPSQLLRSLPKESPGGSQCKPIV